MIPIKEVFLPHEENNEWHHSPWQESYYDAETSDWIERGSSYPNIVKSMEVEILADEREDNYQGDWFFVVKRKDAPQYGWVVCGFGSCSACDALEGAGSYEDLESLRDSIWNDIRWFTSLGDLIKFLQDNLNFQPGDPSDSRALIGQPRVDYYWYGNTETIRTVVEKLVPQVN